MPGRRAAGLYLRALLAPKTEPVGLPLHWTVYAEGEPDAILFAARAANPTFRCRPAATWWRRATDPWRPARRPMSATKEPTVGRMLVLTPGPCGSGPWRRRAGRRWRCHRCDQRGGPGRGGQEGCRRSAGRHVQGQRRLGDAARRPLPGARRAGAGARRALRCRAGGEPGADRRSLQCRAPAAVGRRDAK